MTEGNYDETYEDPILDCDPECDKAMVAPAGRYTNSEHGAYIHSIGPRTFATKRGDYTYLDIAVCIPDVPDVGSVFARTEAYGPHNTGTAKGSRSLAKQFLDNLGLRGKPASEGEGLPVVVEVKVDSYVAKEDELSAEERARGDKPRMTEKNVITNIIRE